MNIKKYLGKSQFENRAKKRRFFQYWGSFQELGLNLRVTVAQYASATFTKVSGRSYQILTELPQFLLFGGDKIEKTASFLVGFGCF